MWASRLEMEAVPFVACGDLHGYDADQSYALEAPADGSAYVPLEPVQAPIAPPYKMALDIEKELNSKSKIRG